MNQKNNEEATEKFRKSLGAWAEIERSSAEREIARATFVGVLEASPELEKFSGWFAALIGSAIVLVLSNLGSLKGSIVHSNLRWGLYLLIASGGMGALARLYGLYVEIYRKVSAEVTKLMVPLVEGYQRKQVEIQALATRGNVAQSTELNFEEVLKQITEPYPWYYRKRIRQAFEAGKKDPLYVYKRAAKLQVRQSHTLMIGVLLSLASVACIAAGLSQ